MKRCFVVLLAILASFDRRLSAGLPRRITGRIVDVRARACPA
jgi:hypothetical protein